MNKLERIREQNNLTQTKMAEQLGISVQRYNSYERKRRKLPLKIAKLISKKFDVSLDDIFLWIKCHIGKNVLNCLGL